MTVDNDDDAHDGIYNDTLSIILGASSRVAPSLDLDLAFGTVASDRNLCQDSCFLQWVTKIVKSKILHCKKAWSNNDMSLLQCVKETIN